MSAGLAQLTGWSKRIKAEFWKHSLERSLKLLTMRGKYDYPQKLWITLCMEFEKMHFIAEIKADVSKR